MRACMCVCMCVCVCVYTCMRVCMYVCVQVHQTTPSLHPCSRNAGSLLKECIIEREHILSQENTFSSPVLAECRITFDRAHCKKSTINIPTKWSYQSSKIQITKTHVTKIKRFMNGRGMLLKEWFIEREHILSQENTFPAPVLSECRLTFERMLFRKRTERGQTIFQPSSC